MKKKHSLKILKDNDGNELRFNYEAFAEAVREKVIESRLVRKKESKAPLRQEDVFLEISEAIAEVTELTLTEDAVKKWMYGKHSPSNYLYICIAAEYFNVPISSLVIYLSPKKEGVRKMNIKEKEVVEYVYQNCIEAFYRYLAGKDAVKRNDKLPAGQRREMKKTEHQIFLEKIEGLHTYIDMNSLMVKGSVLDKLHNILLEFVEIENPMDMERWEEICKVHVDEQSVSLVVDPRELVALANCYTREDGVGFLGVWYIDYEIDLAERYGHYDNKALPDKYFEHVGFDGECYREDGSQVPDEELLAYGCQETDEWGEPIITPRMIYKDQIVTFIREVFKHDFPGLVEE